MPGRSVIITSSRPLSLPSFFSTVTPGQLPTYWLEPVSILNSVVFPQLGFPAKATFISFNLYILSFRFTYSKLITAYGKFNRVSERSYFAYCYLCSFGYAHIHNPASQSAFAIKPDNNGLASHLNITEYCH